MVEIIFFIGLNIKFQTLLKFKVLRRVNNYLTKIFSDGRLIEWSIIVVIFGNILSLPQQGALSPRQYNFTMTVVVSMCIVYGSYNKFKLYTMRLYILKILCIIRNILSIHYYTDLIISIRSMNHYLVDIRQSSMYGTL